jgi:hypothetical protein
MKRVAIFGNAGGGKSTLARQLAEITGLPLHVLDKMQYLPGGAPVPHDEFLQAHAALLEQDEWIIDGYGCPKSLWERLEVADTLIHVDLPLPVHALWVTKRLIKGFFAPPEGWPKGSPLISSSISSYRVLLPCHRHLTPKYRAFAADAACRKRTVRIRSRNEFRRFLREIKEEFCSPRGSEQR